MYRALLTLIVVLVLAPAAGAAVVYEKGSSIYMTSNTGTDTRKLAQGTDPSISPDGRNVVFVRGAGRLYVVATTGGPIGALSSAAIAGITVDDGGGFLTWSPDGTAIAMIDRKDRPVYVPLDGSPARQLATGRSDFMSFSPDGHAIVFDQIGPYSNLFVHTIAANSSAELPQELFGAAWTSGGIVTTRETSSRESVVLVSPTGKLVRVLRSAPIRRNPRKTPYYIPLQSQGRTAVVLETNFEYKGHVKILRFDLVSGAGDRKATKLSYSRIVSVSYDGRRLLNVSRSGRLMLVDVDNGRRRVLVAKGVSWGQVV